jgi:transcriptional regulator with XRE-family HTH domain
MTKEQAKRLGRWLRQRRKESGLSTIELAKRASTSDATITRLEQGAFAAPDPHKLSRIAEALGLNLADVYAMAEYAVPGDLPSFQPYLRRKYGDLPAGAISDLDQAFAQIVKKHGYDPEGPRDGEDEDSDEAAIASDAASIT